MGLFPGLGRSTGGGNGNLLQYSCLENPTDRGAWQAIVHGVTKSQTQLKRLGTHSTIKLTMNVFRISPVFAYTAFYWRGGGV